MKGRQTLFCLVIALAPISANAAPSQANDDAVFEATAIQKAARAHHEAGEYEAELAQLVKALEMLPEEPGYEPMRARILLSIVAAHEAAFEQDGDLARLQESKHLLDDYLGPLDLLDEQGRSDVEQRRADLIDEMNRIEAERYQAAAERAREERRVQADRAHKQARVLNITGTITTSIGVAGFGVMSAGIGLSLSADSRLGEVSQCDNPGDIEQCQLERVDACSGQPRGQCLDSLRARGNSGNIMTITGASVGGALVATGVALLILGRKKRRQAKQLELAPAPQVSRGNVGLSLLGQF